MNKYLKILVSSVLAASMMASLAACGEPESSVPGGDTPGDIFGITTRPENDFENDPNRHDRKPVQRTLTLKGGATFADGSASKVLDSGTKLVLGTDIIVANIPEGKVVCGWLTDDPDDPSSYDSYYAGSDFVTLRKDTVVQPIFDVPSESYASGAVAEGEDPTFGKVPAFAHEQRTGAPQTANNAFVCSDTLLSVNVNNEMGTYFHAMGGTADSADPEQSVPAGWHTLFLSGYQVIESHAYGVTYTVQNFGDEAIDIRVYQTNSSGSYMPADRVSAPVHLEPNEVGQLFVSFSGWNNGNILTTLEVMNTVKELKVGMYGYIADHSEPQSHQLTVTDSKITTKGDATSAEIPAGELVELEYTGALGEEQIFCGWQDVDDATQKYPSKFVMPNRQLSLEPWIEERADHLHTVTLVGDGVTFADGTTTKNLYWNDTLNLSDIKYSGELKPGHKMIFSVFGNGIRSELTGADTYTMPDGDVTITFLRTEVVWSSSNGKVAMTPFEVDGYDANPHKIRADKSQMAPTGGDSPINGKYTGDATSVDVSASIGEIDGEQAAIYDLRGYTQGTGTEEDPERFLDSIAPDAIFMQQINHDTVAGAYTDTATIQNLGDEDIIIQIHISTSSGNPYLSGSSEVITIKPGEVKTIIYDINLAENSSEMISIQYKGAEAVASMKLAMYIYRQPQA